MGLGQSARRPDDRHRHGDVPVAAGQPRAVRRRARRDRQHRRRRPDDQPALRHPGRARPPTGSRRSTSATRTARCRPSAAIWPTSSSEKWWRAPDYVTAAHTGGHGICCGSPGCRPFRSTSATSPIRATAGCWCPPRPATRSPRASWPRSSGSICSARTTGPRAHSRSPNCSPTNCRSSGRAGQPDLTGSVSQQGLAPAPDRLLQLGGFQQPFQRRLDIGLPAQSLLQLQPQPREVSVLGDHDEAGILQQVHVEHALVDRAVTEHLDGRPQIGGSIRGSSRSVTSGRTPECLERHVHRGRTRSPTTAAIRRRGSPSLLRVRIPPPAW